MGNQNQGQNEGNTRQAQGGAGQRTDPQDPKLNPERDDDNTIERRTSDEGQGRNQQASTKRSSGSESESDDTSVSGQPGRSKAGASEQGQTGQSGTTRGGNP